MRTIKFSGYQWTVKQSDEERRGPGPNYFSSSPENVWVDAQGQLHLKLTNRNARWYCAEVSLENSSRYGTYEFFVNGRFDQLDPHIVVGLFLYRDDTHEIDVEFGRWGKRYGDNLQYVLQPGHLPGNIHKYEAKLNGDYTTHSIAWKKDSIAFKSLHGHYAGEVHSSTHLLNLWLAQGQPPMLHKESEIVITRFSFHQNY